MRGSGDRALNARPIPLPEPPIEAPAVRYGEEELLLLLSLLVPLPRPPREARRAPPPPTLQLLPSKVLLQDFLQLLRLSCEDFSSDLIRLSWSQFE